MPREGVPYPERVLCSLKNTIAMIEQKLGLKIEKVNGVGPDPQGNVTLVSGDSALTIEEDATQHQITVGLDRTELPSAAVTSVNGETGAVVLDASEIPYNDPDGYTDDVDEKLNVLTGVQNALQLSINQERTRAQNAEGTLQTNINTVTASLPTAAAAAVAADPTVAQLAVDVPNKVDKITSGSSLKAYTHTGATQGEASVVDGTDANSIGIRDANGRMQAADPASGATDKTLVTANWISQTGNSAPNNVLHKTGNETSTGVKSFQKIYSSEIEVPYRFRRGKSWFYNNAKRYLRIFRYTTNGGVMIRLNIIWGFNTPGRWAMADALISDCGICKVDYHSVGGFTPSEIYICVGTDGYSYLIVSNMGGYNGITVEISNSTRYSQNDDIPGFEMLTEGSIASAPVVGDDYSAVYQGSSV